MQLKKFIEQTNGDPKKSFYDRIAMAESGGKNNAVNPAKGATASGKYQFIESTWKEMVNKHNLGYSLNDRFNPEKSQKVMELFTKENENYLTKKLGRSLNDADLYSAHFLGAGGAEKFLKTVSKNPNKLATEHFSGRVLSDNKSVMYNKDGSPRTVGAVYAELGRRIGDTTAPQAEVEIPRQKELTDLKFTNYLPNIAGIDLETSEKETVDDKVVKETEKELRKEDRKLNAFDNYKQQQEQLSQLAPQQQEQEDTFSAIQTFQGVDQFVSQPLMQNGGVTPPTRQDSLDVYNNAVKVNNFYNNSKDYENTNSKSLMSMSLELNKELPADELKKYLNSGFSKFKDNKKKGVGVRYVKNKDANYSSVNNLKDTEYRKVIDANRLLQREDASSLLNLNAPMSLYNLKISPNALVNYENINKNSPAFKDGVNVLMYDPLAVKPFDLLTDREKEERVKKYGRKGVPESYGKSQKQISSPNPPKPVPLQIRNEQGVSQIIPAGIESQNQSPQGEELPQRTYAQIPTSYDVSSKRYNMQGENPYYDYNAEKTDYETALRAQLSAENYNADIERRYGNEEALKNPKAVERLNQLRQEVTITPNYQNGGETNNLEQLRNKFRETLKLQKGGKIPVSPNGLYDYPNQTVRVPTDGSITMKEISYPVLGTSDQTGEQKVMLPGLEYFFSKTNSVTERPLKNK